MSTSQSLSESAALAAPNILKIFLGIEDRVTEPKPNEDFIITTAAELEAQFTSFTTPFCFTCRVLDRYITIINGLSAVLASRKLQGLSPDTIPLEWTARLGLRSEFKERAETHKCPGCISILKVWNAYMKTGDGIDFDPARYKQYEELNYEMKLSTHRDRETWTLSMIIRCNLPGISVSCVSPLRFEILQRILGTFSAAYCKVSAQFLSRSCL